MVEVISGDFSVSVNVLRVFELQMHQGLLKESQTLIRQFTSDRRDDRFRSSQDTPTSLSTPTTNPLFIINPGFQFSRFGKQYHFWRVDHEVQTRLDS